MRTLVFDNNGDTFDRYTVYIPNGYSGWDRFTMSHNPLSNQGFNQYMDTVLAFNESDKRVYLKDLPKEVRAAIKLRKTG